MSSSRHVGISVASRSCKTETIFFKEGDGGGGGGGGITKLLVSYSRFQSKGGGRREGGGDREGWTREEKTGEKTEEETERETGRLKVGGREREERSGRVCVVGGGDKWGKRERERERERAVWGEERANEKVGGGGGGVSYVQRERGVLEKRQTAGVGGGGDVRRGGGGG